jgi:PAS domain S-box-containing protein
MLSFRNLSIRHKQMLIVMLTSSIALLLACATFTAYELITFRKGMVRNLSTLAEIVGNNTSAALDFTDATAAAETLSALKAEPDIIGACVYARKGGVFARYDRSGDTNSFRPPATASQEGYSFQKDRLVLSHPIRLKGETMGVVYLESDLHALYGLLTRFASIVGLVFLASLLIAFVVSSRLERLVSGPILHLAQVARAVAVDKNYTVRARRQSGDEMGSLIVGFNDMLDQIQQRDAALQSARDYLEMRVKSRTNELASSVSLLNATLEATTDGVQAVDLHGQTTSYNERFTALWGYLPGMLARRDATEMAGFAAAQTSDPEALLARIRSLKYGPVMESLDLVELKDGRIFELYVLPQRLGEECIGAVLTYRDITQRRRAEAELAYERELLRALMDSSEERIYFKDTESRFIRCSKAMLERFGASSMDEVVGRTDFDFFTNEHARPAYDDEQRIIRTGLPLIGKIEREVWKDDRETWVLTTKMPLRDKNGAIVGTFGISKDITEIKEAEAKLEEVHKRLLETSRQAGMAEVATSVLHNVGNVLNSINVSTTLVADIIRKSKLNNLGRVAGILEEHQQDLAAFLTTDPKGSQLPQYLARLAEHLGAEQATLLKEMELTRKHIEHVKDIVMMQQTYAKVVGVAEKIKVTELVEDALRMNAGSLVRHDVKLNRDYPANIPEINVERHKVLQILVNLIRNAKYACEESGSKDKQLTLQVRTTEDRVKIAVIDNGIGIPAANMTRIFNHGFTTRKDGHGFGLHSGALAAREIGGALTARSDGPGKGATFVLELPLKSPHLSEHEL